MKYNRDTFAEEFLCGFYIDGIHVDDIESLYGMYKSKILVSSSMEEVTNLRKNFGFLIWGNAKPLSELYTNIDSLKADLRSDMEHLVDDSEKLNVCVPHIMVKAFVLADKYDVPEYIAAFQYMMSTLPENVIGD